MGKITDFLLSEDWESYQKIQLYKKIGKFLSNNNGDLSPTQLKQIKQMMEDQK